MGIYLSSAERQRLCIQARQGPGEGTELQVRVRMSESEASGREIIVYTYMRPMTMHDQEYDFALAMIDHCLIISTLFMRIECEAGSMSPYEERAIGKVCRCAWNERPTRLMRMQVGVPPPTMLYSNTLHYL